MNKKLLNIDEYKPSERTYDSHVSKLDWNECNLELSEEFQKILLSSISDIILSEYPNIHNNKLLELLANYSNVDSDNIQIFNGSDSALHYIFAALLDAETRVLIYYPNYNQIQTYLKLYTDNISYSQIVDPFNEHVYDFSAIENNDFIYLSNPNNPTGYCLPVETLEQLLNKYKGKYFVIDEAYFEFSNQTCSHLVKSFDNLIVTRTFSKGFSLASVRLGYICADKSIIKLINKIRNTKEVNSFAQALGICVLENKKYVDERIKKIVFNREKFQKQLEINKITFIKSQANFVLVKVKNSEEITKKLSAENILVRDRGMFEGLENTIRITIGKWPDLEKVIKIILENK